MKKTLLSVVFLLSSLVAATASTNTEAATTNYESTQWEYYAAEDYGGGSGTEDDPYLIATVEQFMKLAVEVQNMAFDDNNWNDEYTAGKYWKQTADLVFNEDVLSRVVFASGDASSLSSTDDLLTFTGVGYYIDEYDYQVFAGTYDGDGHTITGLYMNAGSNKSTGLFNNLWGGTVKNLVVEDAYLTGNANVGFIAGKIEEGSSIYNCQTSGIIYCGGSYHAGIAGYVDASQVYNCVSDAWLWAKNNEGGICGRGSTSAEINNCFFSGWIGAVYSNTAKFTAWGAIVSELGASETTTTTTDEDGNETTVCENPSTVKNSYWTDTCTVRHFDGSTIEVIDASLSTYGVTENSYAVSISDLATTVAALNETASTLTGACSWALDDDNKVVLVFDEEEESTESGGSLNTQAATTNYESTQWEYYAAAEYGGGSGTEDDPYLIATVEQFMKLAVEVQNMAFDDNNWNDEYTAGKYWKQTADLVFNEDVLSRVVFASGDASSLSSTDDLLTFTGVGYYIDEYDYQVFAGTYDGDGHTITGLYMNAGSNKSTGLFNNLWGGTVKNLVVEDAYLTGNANVGFIAGKIEEGSSIYNCQTSGIIYCGGSYHAGIAGYVDASQVYNCVSDAWLWAKNNEGGICGRGSTSSEINNCFFSGWIGAVYSNTAKFTAWGAIVSELGASETTTTTTDEDGNETTVCENPSTVKNSYWTDTCTVRHFDGSTIEVIDASLSTYGVTENSYAVSISDLATTVAALNETATGLVEACGWELNEDNQPVLTFETVGTTEISNVATKAENRTVVGYYTLDGMRVSEPVNGVNIVKFSDGSTIKIIK